VDRGNPQLLDSQRGEHRDAPHLARM